MIKIENYEVVGWEHAIRGMRNPMNSWEKGDSGICDGDCDTCPGAIGDTNFCNRLPSSDFFIGPNDHELMMKLAKGGPVHAKYRRMITVYVDITAPLYWWKEFDTYKVGTVANSCSTMHKIHEKEFTMEDFSIEHLFDRVIYAPNPKGIDDRSKIATYPMNMMRATVEALNVCRYNLLETKDKKYWWQMIQLLPSSYNQKRTVMFNYEVLAGIHKYRRFHKLDEWNEFCEWIEQLPYSEIITGVYRHG